MYDLTQEKPYQAEEKHKHVIEFVNKVAADYWESDGFKMYKDRSEGIKFLINQRWRKAPPTKYKFRLGIARAAYDNYVDAYHDLFDVDKLLIFTPERTGDAHRALTRQNEDFANKVLRGAKYKQSLFQRLAYLPDYGWSPAYGDFVYTEGWRIKPQADSQTPGGFTFKKEWDTLTNQPKSLVIHPYRWFGSYCHSAQEQAGQGMVCRWYIEQVIQAMGKVDGEGRPLYNLEVLQRWAKQMQAGKSEASQYYHQDGAEDADRTSKVQYDKASRPYIDVYVYSGPLGCKGYEGDPNHYIVECSGKEIARIAENPVGDFFSAWTHAQTHPYRSSPMSRSFLDAIRPHAQIDDLLINLAVENQVDSLHRFWAFYDDDLLDSEPLKNPRGANSFIELKDRGGFIPKRLGDERSGAMADLQALWKLFDLDRQRVGATDQEMGVQGNTQDKTATAAQILKSASSKRIRAAAKRFSNDAIIPEAKYLVFLALQHYSPEQRILMSKDGEPLQLTPQHVQTLLYDTEWRVNDSITRDKFEAAARAANFYTFAFKFLPTLGQPEYAVRVLNMLGHEQDIPGVDEILPVPKMPTIDSAPELAPAPLPGPQQPAPAAPPAPPEFPEAEMAAMMGGENVAA